ncbi:MAG: type II toxin-antitoxin system CcdA family antitoxin [Pseudomonadota bacterium]
MQIAERAGIAKTTLYSFVSGDTRNLRAETHAAVERALKNDKAATRGLSEEAVLFDGPPSLAVEARKLGLDPEAIAQKAVADAVKRKRVDAWIEDNREAMEANAKDIRVNGLWSDGLRLF